MTIAVGTPRDLHEWLTERGFNTPPRSDLPDGWYPLVDELLIDLAKLGWHRPRRGTERYILQIKEKFGGLRFYVSGATKAQQKRINRAERESYKVCERCGAPGFLRAGGWLTTLCDQHAIQTGQVERTDVEWIRA